MEELLVNIITPYGEIFSGEVRSITLPGSEGEFGVLRGHSHMLSLLKTGVIEIERMNKTKDLVAINWGYAEVKETKVNILADGAVAIGGKDENEISNAISSAKKLLEEATSDKVAISNVVSRIENSARGKIQ
ncbi:ATP synthase F1 subunit epsilon [Helicobacter cappadocius]|uniref:ATP synthase epsilon chain n=1 Tax=Helicobacter cappadocius TaxID=3063998 RepID=A0AA90PIU2_9HELI|nr:MULTISPECIES: ATP synthase F1 subunit epsilon [unclassified Helicobacter]MDO7252753.1 ATP synthase F1 subunit epsilon [Helicobacter sp. faydin-H75]MDP2538621.1 ATP synthase F1 subunit epsilon [Helicobacter sp. faydin-H76]